MWVWQQVLLAFTKLALAALVGGAIGFERETHGEAAGLRTNILVCVGACLMMLLSLYMEELYRHLGSGPSVVRLDPSRIASYAIASMGFLGAGAIITGKGSVRGLTTAAGLWLVTGMGLSIGAGYLLPVIFAAILSLGALYGLRRIKAVFPRDEFTSLTLKYRGPDKPLEHIKKILAEHGISVQFVNYQHDLATDPTTYRLRLQSKENAPWGEAIKIISGTKGLEELQWQEGEVP